MRDPQDLDVLSEGRPRRWSGPLPLALVVAAAVVVVDQLTKRWALATLTPGSCGQPDACIDLVAGIRFHLVFNTGAAFTTGSGLGPVLAVLAMAMTSILLVLASRQSDRRLVVLFGVIAGGAVGNLLDRIFRADDGLLSGAVVDFVDVGWWPVFNVADSAIVVGVLLVIARSFMTAEPDPQAEPEAPADDGPAEAAEAGEAVEADEAVEAGESRDESEGSAVAEHPE